LLWNKYTGNLYFLIIINIYIKQYCGATTLKQHTSKALKIINLLGHIAVIAVIIQTNVNVNVIIVF